MQTDIFFSINNAPHKILQFFHSIEMVFFKIFFNATIPPQNSASDHFSNLPSKNNSKSSWSNSYPKWQKESYDLFNTLIQFNNSLGGITIFHFPLFCFSVLYCQLCWTVRSGQTTQCSLSTGQRTRRIPCFICSKFALIICISYSSRAQGKSKELPIT